MIERIIENWLDNSSERSYQLPFCYMLIEQGQTILHLTRHTAMEHGKDIIAMDREGAIHAYQLKGTNGAKLKLREWQEIFPQLIQLVYTPITHPSARSDQHHHSYLVLNGEIEEEAFNAIHAYNSDKRIKNQEQYQINTIVRGQILEWAYSLKDQLIPTELKEVKSLLEFYLHNGEGFLGKEAFFNLLRSILMQPPRGAVAAKRLISSAALLCSIALSQYQEKGNFVAVIEGWLIYSINILLFVEANGLAEPLYREEIMLADKIIVNALEDLADECIVSKDLISGNLGSDILVFKHRVTILYGLLAYFGLRTLDNPALNEKYRLSLAAFFDKHSSYAEVWGEGAVPYLVTLCWYYDKVGEVEKSTKLLKSLFVRCQAEFTLDKESTFTNYFLSAEETIVLLIDERKEKRDCRFWTMLTHLSVSCSPTILAC